MPPFDSYTCSDSSNRPTCVVLSPESAENMFAEMFADFKAEMQKSNAKMQAEFQVNTQQANAATLDAFFHKCGQTMGEKVTSTSQSFEITYLKPTQDLEQRVTTQVGEINANVKKSLKKQEKTINEIAQDSYTLRSTVEALAGEIDKQIASSELRLRRQIEKLDGESSEAINGVIDQVKNLQSAVFKSESRVAEFTSTIGSQPTDTASSSSHYTSTLTIKTNTIESTILLRRKLIEGGKSVTKHFQPNATYTAASSLGTTANLENAPSFNTYHAPPGIGERRQAGVCCSCLRTPLITIKPFDGDPKNYSRFKSKFMILYHREFEDDASRLCILDELLVETVRNEIGECLAGMYAVVWDRLDAVYGRPEVMDHHLMS